MSPFYQSVVLFTFAIGNQSLCGFTVKAKIKISSGSHCVQNTTAPTRYTMDFTYHHSTTTRRDVKILFTSTHKSTVSCYHDHRH